MLVLARTAGERIIITAPCGTEIILTMVEIRGYNARLGIDAPKDWRINREEIQQRMDAEKQT